MVTTTSTVPDQELHMQVVDRRTAAMLRTMFVPAGTATPPTDVLRAAQRNMDRAGRRKRKISCATAVATTLLDSTCSHAYVGMSSTIASQPKEELAQLTAGVERDDTNTALMRSW